MGFNLMRHMTVLVFLIMSLGVFAGLNTSNTKKSNKDLISLINENIKSLNELKKELQQRKK